MTRLLPVLAGLLILPASASAQQQLEGLDLTEDPKKEEEKKEGKTDEGAPAEEGTATSTPLPPLPDDPAPPKTDQPLLGERDITQEDRVKSVQRKVYMKRYRFELTPSVIYSVNDPYYSKFGFTGRLGFFLADTLAVGVRAINFQVIPSNDVKVAKRNFQSQIFFSVPYWGFLGDVEWSPIYGKVAFFNSILHFDGYLTGGVGAVLTETSTLPDRGPNPAAEVGLGMRFVAKDFLAVNVSVVNVTYVDQPAGTTKGNMQNIMLLNAGVSVFFPFKSTGRESE